MQRIGLVVHPDRDAAKELAVRVRAWWERHGFAVVEMQAAEDLPGNGAGLEDLAFAVSLGGDGTMLRAVQLVLTSAIPVLGVNLGNLGYLTQVEPHGIEEAFERLLSGMFSIEERVTLDVTVDGGNQNSSHYLVLNEVALEKTAPGHTVHLGLAIDGRPFLTYVADGLIVSTPTGSTAYNLSLRGPILSPTLRAMVLTPVSPHMLFDRSLVLDATQTVAMDVLDDRPAELVVDGSTAQTLDVGSAVKVVMSEHVARIVDFGGIDFHGILRAKFGLADR